jgi:hypothetical protein
MTKTVVSFEYRERTEANFGVDDVASASLLVDGGDGGGGGGGVAGGGVAVGGGGEGVGSGTSRLRSYSAGCPLMILQSVCGV